MSNISGDEGSFSTANTGEEVHQENKLQQPLNHPHGSSSGVRNSNSSTNQQQQQANKKNRNLPGTPGNYSTLSFSFCSCTYSLINPKIFGF